MSNSSRVRKPMFEPNKSQSFTPSALNTHAQDNTNRRATLTPDLNLCRRTFFFAPEEHHEQRLYMLTMLLPAHTSSYFGHPDSLAEQHSTGHVWLRNSSI